MMLSGGYEESVKITIKRWTGKLDHIIIFNPFKKYELILFFYCDIQH